MNFINAKFFSVRNFLFILVVIVIVHHFAKGWFAGKGDAGKGDAA